MFRVSASGFHALGHKDQQMEPKIIHWIFSCGVYICFLLLVQDEIYFITFKNS